MNAIAKFRKCTLTDDELIAEVDRQTDQMYTTGKVPSRHIPAQPNNDFDLLVGELIMRVYERHVKPADGDTIADPMSDGDQIKIS